VKIYFDNVNFGSRSGPNTFAHRLAESLTSNHAVDIVKSNDDCDVFLCFIEPTQVPKTTARFIQRLDGIWFKPEQFHAHNLGIRWAYDNSHHVIWQSNFDMGMTTRWWGNRSGTVIHNGIKASNVRISEPFISLRARYDRVFVSSANWHRQKRLKENIELFRLVANDNDVMIVLGKNPDYHSEDPRIIFFGDQDHDTCMQVYSIADWMIHLAWLDHCPNVVIEAISCGCPVICTDSGGTKEIVGKNGIILNEDIGYNFELLDYDKPYNFSFPDIQLIKPDIDSTHLNIDIVTEKYYDVLTGGGLND